MEGNRPRLAQSQFWLICYYTLIENERKLASAGSELMLVDLLSNSNASWLARQKVAPRPTNKKRIYKNYGFAKVIVNLSMNKLSKTSKNQMFFFVL